MQGTPQDAIRVGVVHHASSPEARTPHAALETITRLLTDPYFQAVEVGLAPDDAMRRAAASAVAAGKEIYYRFQPLYGNGLHLSSPDPKTRLPAVREARKGLAEAVAWGASAFAVPPGPDAEAKERFAAKSWLMASLKELCEHTRRMKGPRIALDAAESAGNGRLIHSCQEAAEVIGRVGAFFPNYAALLIPLEKQDAPANELSRLYQRIFRAGTGLTHDGHAAARLAECLRRVLAAAAGETPAKPLIIFEPAPLPGTSPEAALAEIKRTLDAAWAML